MVDQDKQKRSAMLADGALILVAAIWGGGFVAGKMALVSFSPVQVLMYRFCAASFILGIVFFKRIRLAGKAEIRYGCISGVLQFAALLVQLVALQYTTPGKQAFLAAAYVVFTPFVSWWMIRTKPVKKEVVAALAALIGIGMISLNAQMNMEAGDLLTLVFAILFAAQIVYVGKYVREVDAIVMTFYQFATAGVLALLAALLTGISVTAVTHQAVYGVLYLAVINTAFATCLQNVAQRHTKDSHTALILSFESVFGFFLSVLLYQETVSVRMICGCVIVFVAVLGSCYKKTEQRIPEMDSET